MSKKYFSAATLLLLLSPGLNAWQQAPPADPCKKPLDQKKVDEAGTRGCQYLLDKIDEAMPPVNRPQGMVGMNVDAELLLLALVHGKAFSPSNEKCRKLLEYVLNNPPRHTYRTALKAMALAALDKGKYVEYIAQCGQFLVDTQTAEGRWGYFGDSAATGTKPQLRASSNGKTGAAIKLQPRSGGGSGGDYSNTQYAALGLRACFDAGIEVPQETLELAKQGWEKFQLADGGWRYEKNEPSVAMTAGGVSSLSIVYYLLGEVKKKEDFGKIRSIAGGIKWLHEDLIRTSGSGYWNVLYSTYSVERAGMLAQFTSLGGHDWYKEGANILLGAQQADGSWVSTGKVYGGYGQVPSTAFAILFLRKATESLIDTGKKTPEPKKIEPPKKPEPKDIDTGNKK